VGRGGPTSAMGGGESKPAADDVANSIEVSYT